MYNGQRQFNANVFYKSSWALFSTDRLTPIGTTATAGAFAFSGAKSSFSKRDGDVVNAMKKWASTFCA